MNDFVLENGRLVRWRRRPILEDVSLVILMMPLVVMVGLLWLKGMATTASIVEVLRDLNQFKLGIIALLLIFFFVRLLLYKGERFVFDRGRNEIERRRVMRFGLGWTERWRMSDIVAIEAVPYGDASWAMAEVVVRFRGGDAVVAREAADAGSSALVAQRLRDYVGLVAPASPT